MIELKDIYKQINLNIILNHITLTFNDSGLYFLTGDNGCGKTTLLYLLAMLDNDYTGDYLIDGKNISLLPKKEREKERIQNISLLLPKGNLIDFLSVEENICLYSNPNADSLKNNYGPVSGLSGGEEILIALENEIGKNKKILLLDEVTSTLSDENVKRVMDVFLKYSMSHLVIMASHDTRVIDKGIQIRMKTEGENPYSLYK